jgi:predicted nucleic acid-binding protein
VTVFVFDSSAVLRYLDREAGADRMRAIFRDASAKSAAMHISALQWAEIAAILRKRYGAKEQDIRLRRLMQLDLRIVPVTAERAVRAAAIRVDRRICFADAFAVELAMDSADHLLVTADYDFKDVVDLASIEFLPPK